jgi:hypothetical protein
VDKIKYFAPAEIRTQDLKKNNVLLQRRLHAETVLLRTMDTQTHELQKEWNVKGQRKMSYSSLFLP